VRYTQKQIDKFNRQKYMTELDKMSKNLFKMFREESITADTFCSKFEQLKKKLDARVEVHLESTYHQQLKAYILRLYLETCENENFIDKTFDAIREAEMSNLNRLQKLKNGSSYKKDKHKAKHANEDWG